MKERIFFLFLVFISEFALAQKPTANFTATGVCFNNPNQFTDLSIGNPTVSQWEWDFGDSNISSQQNPSHMYGAIGTFTVTLIITNNFGNKDTITKAVSVHPLPVADFAAPSGCFGNTSCITDLSTVALGSISSWVWNFGDPSSGSSNISGLQTPCHSFSGSGTFNIILTATTDSGCQNTIIHPVIIYNPPAANFMGQDSGSAPVCANYFDLSTSTDGTISSWKWSFPGGTPVGSTAVNPQNICYYVAGTYSVCLKVTSSTGCVDSTCQTITVLGIEENYLYTAVSVHPSISSSGIFTISIVQPQIQVLGLEVYDWVGRKNREVLIDKATTQVTLLVEKNGIYFVKINMDAGSITRKVIVSR